MNELTYSDSPFEDGLKKTSPEDGLKKGTESSSEDGLKKMSSEDGLKKTSSQSSSEDSQKKTSSDSSFEDSLKKMDSESSSKDDLQTADSESPSEDSLSMEQAHYSFLQAYLAEHSSEKLRLPQAFIDNFKEGVPEKISLKNSSGRVWPAKLTYSGNILHITHGWQHYVKDHKLESGEFVLFSYQHDSTFLVTVYGADGMLKHEPQKKKTSKKSRGKKRCTDVGSMMFYKTFNSKFKSFVAVPKQIVDECISVLPYTVKLTNDRGRGIEIPLRRLSDRAVLGYAGLSSFWRKNGVEVGDKLKFEVIYGDGNNIERIVMTNITRSKEFRRGY